MWSNAIHASFLLARLRKSLWHRSVSLAPHFCWYACQLRKIQGSTLGYSIGIKGRVIGDFLAIRSDSTWRVRFGIYAYAAGGGLLYRVTPTGHKFRGEDDRNRLCQQRHPRIQSTATQGTLLQSQGEQTLLRLRIFKTILNRYGLSSELRHDFAPRGATDRGSLSPSTDATTSGV